MADRTIRNPFRSEAEAFQLVVVLAIYCGAIIAASLLGGLWPGLAVFALGGAALAWWIFSGGRAEPPVPTASRPHPPGEKRILVVANETVGGQTLRDCIRAKTEGVREEVFVVSPALNSPLRHWASDEDGARRVARERLEASLAKLEAAGIRARGEVGDTEPLQAIEDALRTFGADEIIISTHPEGRSHWLERGIVEEARRRFTVPITHVVVDLDAEREEVR